MLLRLYYFLKANKLINNSCIHQKSAMATTFGEVLVHQWSPAKHTAALSLEKPTFERFL